jgi:hypothetical protein
VAMAQWDAARRAAACNRSVHAIYKAARIEMGN